MGGLCQLQSSPDFSYQIPEDGRLLIFEKKDLKSPAVELAGKCATRIGSCLESQRRHDEWPICDTKMGWSCHKGGSFGISGIPSSYLKQSELTHHGLSELIFPQGVDLNEISYEPPFLITLDSAHSLILLSKDLDRGDNIMFEKTCPGPSNPYRISRISELDPFLTRLLNSQEIRIIGKAQKRSLA